MPTIQVDGLEIGYDRAGEGPPILFLHGSACSALIWKPQLEVLLADEFTVIAWDEPGAGRSSDLPDEGLGFADYAAAAAALIDRIGAGPAHVRGLSWGGVLAQQLYRHYPEVVATLILCGTYAGWAGSLTKQEVESRSRWSRRRSARRSLRPGFPAGSPESRQPSTPTWRRGWRPKCARARCVACSITPAFKVGYAEGSARPGPVRRGRPSHGRSAWQKEHRRRQAQSPVAPPELGA